MDIDIDKLIDDLTESIKYREEEQEDMDHISWSSSIGVLISGNEAKFIVEILRKHKNQSDLMDSIQQLNDELDRVAPLPTDFNDAIDQANPPYRVYPWTITPSLPQGQNSDTALPTKPVMPEWYFDSNLLPATKGDLIETRDRLMAMIASILKKMP